jgi:hypothetical protein
MSRPSRRTAAISAFVRVVLRQIVSDRTTLFFFVVLPVAVIVIIGATFGTGGSLAVGVHRGSAPSEVTDGVIEGLDAADGVVVIEFDSVGQSLPDALAVVLYEREVPLHQSIAKFLVVRIFLVSDPGVVNVLRNWTGNCDGLS